MVKRLVLYDGEQQRFEGHLGHQRGAVFPHPHQGVLDEFLGAYRRRRSAWRRCRAVCNSGGKAHRNIFHPPHGAVRQPCGCSCMSIVCALSAIGRYILRARRPEERRRDKAKIQLYPIFAKKIPYRAYSAPERSMPEGNRGTGAGNAVSGGREGGGRGRRRIAAASGSTLPPGGDASRHRPGSRARHGREYHGGKPEYSRLMSGNRNRGAGIPPNFITFAGQARPVAAGRGRERKVRATQSTAQANDLISVRV